MIGGEDDHYLILVVPEGLFSMDADMPDIAAIQEVCRQFDAVHFATSLFGSGGPPAGADGQQVEYSPSAA